MASKENKLIIFLGGECPADNGWRKELKKEYSDTYIFIDPFDKNWTAEENIYTELSDAATADYAIFYKGGEGTVKEKEFLDTLGIPYEEFTDVEELYEYLDSLPDTAVQTIPAGSVITVDDVPVKIQDSVEALPLKESKASICKVSALCAQATMEHTYGCLMVPVPHFVRTYLLKEFLAENIPANLLNADEAMHGIESDTHITLLYGLKAPVCDEAIRVLKEIPAISISTGSKVEYFDNEDSTVVYVPIDSVELEELHYRLATELPNADSHPVYIPHITLAYLKPGSRLDNESLQKFTFKMPMVLVSYPDGSVDHALVSDLEIKDLAEWLVNPE